MKFSAASALIALGLALSACGGGGDSAPATSSKMSQAEATSIAFNVSSAHYLALDAQALSARALSQLAAVATPGTASSAGIACSTSGSYAKSWNKLSSAGNLGAGDTITLTYNACNDGTLVISGVVTSTLASPGGTATSPVLTANVIATNAAVSYTGLPGTDLLNASFSNTISVLRTSVYSYAVAGTGAFTGQLSGFSSAAAVRNGSYSLSNVSVTQTLDATTGTTRASETFGFSSLYTGSDGNAYQLALTTATNIQTSFDGVNFLVTTPGVFTITGYKTATIGVTTNSTTSATVKVDDASDGVADMTFTISGVYLL